MPPRSADKPNKRIRRRPEESRELILAAAVHVLSDQGPHAVGLKEVAQEAGVSHALVTHYFGSYDALVEATIKECNRQIRDRLLEQLNELSEPSVPALLDAWLATVAEPRYTRLLGLILLSGREATAEQAQLLAPDMKPVVRAARALQKANPKIDLTPSQIDSLIVMAWSMGVGYAAGRVFFWNALGRQPTARRDREIRELVRTFAERML